MKISGNVKNLTGKKFGMLTAVEYIGTNDKGRAKWLCACECGNETEALSSKLRGATALHCGCKPNGHTKDLTGQRFGKIVVLEYVGTSTWRHARWRCKCDCGTVMVLQSSTLISGGQTACGCNRKLRLGEAALNILFKQDYKRNAAKRGIEFELTKEEFRVLTKGNCHYCGAEPTRVTGSPNLNGGYIYNGVDRIDNDKGYTAANSVPCCKECNISKGSQTMKEFKAWIKRLHAHMEATNWEGGSV